jgi:hypothetical protein
MGSALGFVENAWRFTKLEFRVLGEVTQVTMAELGKSSSNLGRAVILILNRFPL